MIFHSLIFPLQFSFLLPSEKHFAFFFLVFDLYAQVLWLREQRAKQARQHTQCVYVYFLLLIHFFTTPNVDRGKTIQRPIARSFNSDFFLSSLSAFLSSGSYWCCCCFRNNAHTFSGWCGRYLKHYTVFFYY